MAYPVGTAYSGTNPSVAYSGTFIPQIWSGKLIEKFYNATVLAAISNTDYEGEIKNQGDTVNIRVKPTITINAYSADMALTVQRPSSNIVVLSISNGYYFNLVEDDVFAVQSDINMLSMWADDAAQQLKITIDTQVLSTLYASVASANTGSGAGKITGAFNLGAPNANPANAGTPVVVDNTNILNYIIDLGTVLDEQNIPEQGRWLVIPSWIAGFIKKSDLRQVSISGDGVSILRNGLLGMIDRFTVYASNLLPTSSVDNAWYIFAGHSHGLTFASQISKIETLRSEQTFGTLLRGLQIYGSKVVDGTALACLYATPNTGAL
jgi:hypothetical protein